MVGKLLKEIYIDGAVRKADKLTTEANNEDGNKEDEIREAKNISWSDYKKQRQSIETDITEVLGVD